GGRTGLDADRLGEGDAAPRSRALHDPHGPQSPPDRGRSLPRRARGPRRCGRSPGRPRGAPRGGDRGAPAAPRMRVLILAAGFGTRLGPLGEEAPKGLLAVAGRPAIEFAARAAEALAAVRALDVVTNARFHGAFAAWV